MGGAASRPLSFVVVLLSLPPPFAWCFLRPLHFICIVFLTIFFKKKKNSHKNWGQIEPDWPHSGGLVLKGGALLGPSLFLDGATFPLQFVSWVVVLPSPSPAPPSSPFSGGIAWLLPPFGGADFPSLLWVVVLSLPLSFIIHDNDNDKEKENHNCLQDMNYNEPASIYQRLSTCKLWNVYAPT